MTITLTPEVEARLKGAASHLGLDPAQYAGRLIERGLSESAKTNDNRATLALLDQWERRDQTSDPAEIARRNAEFEEFKAAMNRNRIESEGPNARKVYP